jgi:hypothetical protein
MSDDLFEDVELQTPSNTETGTQDVVASDTPLVTSPEWNDYVMGLFEKNELIEGRPLSAGLRRVAELLLGRIVSSGPVQVFPPANGNEIGRATVVWEVQFADGSRFSDVADCWEGNTDDTFCVYAVATAATRAEGRSFRKALRLRTVAAEEVTSKNTASITRSISQTKTVETTGEYEDSDRMTDAQANFVDAKCRQLNIDGADMFKNVFDISVKRKITKREASLAIEKLNDYQRGVLNVPDNITGYSEDWRG